MLLRTARYLCFFIAYVIAFPGTAKAEDLWDIYQLARKNDAQYLAAAARFRAAELELPIAESEFKSTIGSTGAIAKQRSGASGSNVTSDNNQLSVDYRLLLYDKAAGVGITQAALRVENARIQFANAENDLALRVTERYFNVLAARDNREVARLQKVAIKRQMDLADERLDVGLGTRTDSYDAKARFEQANADLIAAEIQINNARQALVEIINTRPRSIAVLADDSPLDRPEPNDVSYWTNLAKKQNLQVVSEGINLLIASHEIDRQRLAKKPTVTFNARQSWNDGSGGGFSDSDFHTTSIGVSVNLPLYLGGSTRLRTAQAGHQFNAAEQSLLASERLAATQANSAFLDVTSGISQVEALAEAIRAGENALQAREEGFSAGLTTNLDVLDAQRDLSQSRTNYLRAKYNYIIALIRLEQHVGDLNDDDLQRINQWLNDDHTVFRLEQKKRQVLLAQHQDQGLETETPASVTPIQMQSFDLSL